MKEVWKEIIWTDGLYAVSSFGGVRRVLPGRVRSDVAGKVLRQNLNLDKKTQYRQVILNLRNGSIRSVLVHRLVLEAFAGACPDGMECNHKNGEKGDNRIENLEWVSRSENHKHAYKLGLHPVAKNFGASNGMFQKASWCRGKHNPGGKYFRSVEIRQKASTSLKKYFSRSKVGYVKNLGGAL